jgi:hypothetical protein
LLFLESKFIIDEGSNFKFYWDMFIILLAIYNAFSIPFYLAFSPPFSTSLAREISDDMIDILFLCDILIHFRTSYYHPDTGEEIFNPKMIAKHYFF